MHSLFIVRNIGAFFAALIVYLGLVIREIKGPMAKKNDGKKEREVLFHGKGRLSELQILTGYAKPKI